MGTDFPEKVVPTGSLVHLKIDQIRPSPSNPRHLFDPAPLEALKESIRAHGVLVPLTVYKLPGQDRYGIVDGERRYRCSVLLAEEGIDVSVPANVVAPPDAMASLIYMFNIHSFREQWELMPTAIGLRRVIEHLGDPSDEEIQALTGLSTPQIRRCKLILSFAEKYQELSLVSDPAERIPSNFWVELAPIIELAKQYVPDLVRDIGTDGVIDHLIQKYRNRGIRSVVHFRRIAEAFEANSQSKEDIERVSDAFRGYVLDVSLETRAVFDKLIVEQRRIQKASDACVRFVSDLVKAKAEFTVDADDRAALIKELKNVVDYATALIDKLSATDPPESA